MRQLLASIFTLLLTASIALGLDAQTKAEIDELITYVQTSGVRFIRNGLEYSGAEGAQHLRDKLAKAGDRVKTTEDFITGIASKSFLSGKPYLVKFTSSPSHHRTVTADLARLKDFNEICSKSRKLANEFKTFQDPLTGVYGSLVNSNMAFVTLKSSDGQ
jgi:hypothetical protein